MLTEREMKVQRRASEERLGEARERERIDSFRSLISVRLDTLRKPLERLGGGQ